jgi:tetratricopeptide (TPR) repeat protein
LSPGNYEALKMRVVVLLARHDFAEALTRAGELNHRVPDDTAVWGYLADANMAIGEYAEAIKDAQWILDLRRGSTLGFVKAAASREMAGDGEGAIEFYDEALLRTPSGDPEERCWLLTQNARLQLASGNAALAGERIGKAIALNPESQLAAGILAKLEASEGNFDEAVRLRKQLAAKTATANNLYDLAVLLESSGRTAEAETVFREFESKARKSMSETFNANRELVFYYADHLRSPAEALKIAAREIEARHDSGTLDAYAWALFRSGKFDQAETQIERALAPGVRDGVYFCHALRIAEAKQDPAAVTRARKELASVTGAVCPAASEDSK